MAARKWRLEPRNLATGRHWRLRTGRGATREQLELGRVTTEQAERAKTGIQMLEDLADGRLQRWRQWHAEDRAAAVTYLCGDRADAAELDQRPEDPGGLTLDEYVAQHYGPWRAADRPKTWRNEERLLKRIGLDLGTTPLRAIDAHLVADYLDTLVCTRGPRTGQPFSGNMKRLTRAALQAILHRAYRLKHLAHEPDLSAFAIRGSTRTVAPEVEPLSIDELARLMDVSDGKYRAMWAVGAGLGLRPSELCRLDWSGVHWGSQTLAIPGDERGEGKTASSVATIPMVPLAVRELRAWWLACERPAAGLVFPSRDGKPYGPSGYRAALKSAAAEAKINRHVTPYLLRHSFATIAWSLGIDKDVTRRILRHTDPRMLDKVYQRPRPRELVERVRAFEVPGLREVEEPPASEMPHEGR